MLIQAFALPFLWSSPRFGMDMLMIYVHVNHRISRDALGAMVIEARTFFPGNKRDKNEDDKEKNEDIKRRRQL